MKIKGKNAVKKGRKWKAGFTLVELLVAIAIVGIALVPMVTGYVSAWRMGMNAERRSDAQMLGNWLVDYIQAVHGHEGIDDIADDGEMKDLIEDHDAAVGTESLDEYYEKYSMFDYVIVVDDDIGAHSGFDGSLVQVSIEYPDIMTGENRTIRCSDLSEVNAGECSDFSFLVTSHYPPESE